MTALVGPSGAGKTTLGLQFLAGSVPDIEIKASGQRKNSTLTSRNQTVLGGAAEIGPLMPKTAS